MLPNPTAGEANIHFPDRTIDIGDKKVTIRPINAMDSFLLANEMVVIASVFGEIAAVMPAEESPEQFTSRTLKTLLGNRGALQAIATCVNHLITVPLTSLPPEASMALAKVFIEQNFTQARLSSWGDQIRAMGLGIKAVATTPQSSTSAT